MWANYQVMSAILFFLFQFASTCCVLSLSPFYFLISFFLFLIRSHSECPRFFGVTLVKMSYNFDYFEDPRQRLDIVHTWPNASRRSLGVSCVLGDTGGWLHISHLAGRSSDDPGWISKSDKIHRHWHSAAQPSGTIVKIGIIFII